LKLRLDAAFAAGINVRALVVINPGNPTGQVWRVTRVSVKYIKHGNFVKMTLLILSTGSDRRESKRDCTVL
jgi:translation elongation factor P/translation initiation factor 5A